MKLIFIFLAVYSLYSCTFVFYTDKQHPRLPSLHTDDYGNIQYVNKVTDEKAKLTTFWGQEAVFAPEARELLQDMEQQGFRFNVSKVGIVDDGFVLEGMEKTRIDATVLSALPTWWDISDDEAHGTHVSNLITGEAPVGVSSRGKITMIETNDGLSSLKISNPPPVLNASLIFGHEGHIEHANKLLDKTIFVSAVGNSFNDSSRWDVETAHRKSIEELGNKMLVVGSLDPSGFVSDFSQEHQHVTVLAPSDHFIMSHGAKGKLSKFSGTSGATPLVSGAVADLRSIIPDLTRDEVATIITKTATPTSINTVSKLDGHGTLNQYKMLRVGQRLAENGWPNDRANLINDKSMYNFDDEAKKLADKAEALLKTGDETDYKAGFKKLRTAFALDTSNSKTRTLLANIYRDAGYHVQAMFYDIPARSAQQASTIKKIAHRTSVYWERVLDLDVFLNKSNFYSVVKPFGLEKWYNKFFDKVGIGHSLFFNYYDYHGQLLSNMEKSGVQLGAEQASHDLYAAKNLTTQQQLLIHIELFSYGKDEKAEQMLSLLVEYARAAHPEVMTEPVVQKVIAKHNLTTSSRRKHLIYSLANHIAETNSELTRRDVESLELGTDKNRELARELGKALQEVDRQPDLMHNDPVIAKYAKQKGVSVADLWQILRKLVKLAP